MTQRISLSPEFWDRIAADCKASCLSRESYYRNRLAAQLGDAPLPSLCTFHRQLRQRDQGAQLTRSVAVRSLSADQISKALHPTTTGAKSKTTTVSLTFANGTHMQFETASAELLALSMHKLDLGVIR